MNYVVISFVVFVVSYFVTGIRVVPQTQNFLVERLGKYHRTLGPGFHIIIPVYESVSRKIDVLERQLDPRKIGAITLDNVEIDIRLAILFRIFDASRAAYRVQDLENAILTTVTGVVRSVIGTTDLDGVQSNRRSLASTIEEDLKSVTEEWGIILSRVEIIDITIDEQTRDAMQKQLNAERNRRALVKQAEGAREAAQLQADADLYTAQKQAEARKTLADADAYAVAVVAKAIADNGQQAVNFEVQKIQAEAIKNLGTQQGSKLVLLPTSLFDAFGSLAAGRERGA